MLEARHLLYHSNKISFILWYLPWRLCFFDFSQNISCCSRIFFHSLKYLLQLSFWSSKYLLFSCVKVLDFFGKIQKLNLFYLILKFSLVVYQQVAASTASTLPCWIMSLFKMTFELLFTSKQNSRTFVAHYNVFIHNLSIQEQTCLSFKRCCSKSLMKRLTWFL